MYFSGPQTNIDSQVEEYRAAARYHRAWAKRLNLLGWGAFGAGIVFTAHRPAGAAGICMLLIVAGCWCWRYYEETKEREAREELWEYCREAVQKLHKWEGKHD